MCSWFGFF
jgi:hypothetical protein